MPAQGIFVRPDEIEDYTAVWRLVAHYMGTPTEPFATHELAKAYLDSILLSEMDPSGAGKVLANNIIAALADQPPIYPSADLLRAEAYWMNGPELCKLLEIPEPSLFAKVLMISQVCFWAFSCYLNRLSEKWDDVKVSRVRKSFKDIFIDGKYGLVGIAGAPSKFELQYVPQYATITGLAKPPLERNIWEPRRMERTYLVVLAWFVGGCLFALYIIYRLGRWLALKW